MVALSVFESKHCTVSGFRWKPNSLNQLGYDEELKYGFIDLISA
jgi:hypothetical protein